ncbi:MAG: BrnA antitoxin family protein [Methylococcaceae bacterium]
MANPLPLTNEDGEVRELTADDFKQFRPATEVLYELFSPEIATELLASEKNNSPYADDASVFTPIKLDAEVLNYFKSTGTDWQNHINDALKQWLKEHLMS